MKISDNSTKNKIAFQSARLNILAMADNHGCIGSLPQLIKTIDANTTDIFKKTAKESTLNIFAIPGDYFFSPDNVGLITHKDKTFGDIQRNFLIKIIENIKNKLGQKAKFETLFTLGNHDLEGGAPLALDLVKDVHMTTLFTNANLSKSPLLKNLMQTHDNLVTSKIYQIPDNKNPEITNHVLFLGMTIPRKKFNGKKLQGLAFYDRLNKNDSTLERNDFSKTYKVLNYHVRNFKAKHLDGAVVLLSHAGSKVSGFTAEEVPCINLILNAHDHLKTDDFVNNTLISSLGENNQFVKALNLKFDDDGKIAKIKVQRFKTEEFKNAANEDSMQDFIKENIGEDIKPLVDLSEHRELIDELKYTKDVRFANKLFVNYVTSSIKEALKISRPDVDMVALPSEAFRGGLVSIDGEKPYFDNIDLIKMFGGINKDNSRIRIGRLTGKELSNIIINNVLKNIDAPKENGILHWSDIKVDRTLIAQIKNNETPKQFKDAVKYRNPETKEYENLDPLRTYNIAMSDKYLIKELSKTKDQQILETKFESINDTYPSLLKEYLELVDYKLEFSDEVKELRIY